MSITIAVKTNRDYKLLRSIKKRDIRKSLKEKNIYLTKKQILLDKEIDTLGAYKIKLDISEVFESFVIVWIVKR